MSEGTDRLDGVGAQSAAASIEPEKLNIGQWLKILKPSAIAGMVVSLVGVAGAGYWVGQLRAEMARPQPGATPPDGQKTAASTQMRPGDCVAVREGAFDSNANGRSHESADWHFREGLKGAGNLSFVADASEPAVLAKKAIRLERKVALERGRPLFEQPDRSDFTRIEWSLPTQLQGKRVRVNVALRWGDVRPFEPWGRTGTVAINFKSDAPAGSGLIESPVGQPSVAMSNQAESSYQVLLAEATPSMSWTKMRFPAYWMPVGTSTLRIGLHAVYGWLEVDDLWIEVCS